MWSDRTLPVTHPERPKSKDGESVVYRLKDWPSGEEFMALMPSRFQHLHQPSPHRTVFILN